MSTLANVMLWGLWCWTALVVLVDHRARARQSPVRPLRVTAEDVGAWLVDQGATLAPLGPPAAHTAADPPPPPPPPRPARPLRWARPPVDEGPPHSRRRCYGSGRFVPPSNRGDRVAACGVCGGLVDIDEPYPGGPATVADHQPPENEAGAAA